MRALLTGAGGFVGGYLTAHLRESGDDVVGLGEEVDVTDADAVHRAMADARPDAVYHLAAASHVGSSWSAPAEVLRVNAIGTLHVVLAAEAAGAERVLVVGSAEQYGLVRPDQLPIAETAPLRPVSPYGASKVAAEVVALQAHLARGAGVLLVRAFNHLGPGQSDRLVASALAAQVARNERSGDEVVHVGDLSPRRDFTDVRDVVRAYRLLATAGEAAPPVVNVCSGRTASGAELIAGLERIAGVAVDHRVDTGLVRAHEVMELRGSFERLHAVTGWEPGIPLERTLADTVAWWRGEIRAGRADGRLTE